MSKNELNDDKFENKEINYSRFKKSSNEHICLINDEFKIKRSIKSSGYDSTLQKWETTSTEIEVLDPETCGYYKTILQNIFIKRSGTDAFLKPIHLWLKMVRRITVKDSPNIFLKSAHSRIFQVDAYRGQSAPLAISNQSPKYLKIEDVSLTPLTPEEMQKLSSELNDPHIYFKPVVCSETQEGELKLII